MHTAAKRLLSALLFAGMSLALVSCGADTHSPVPPASSPAPPTVISDSPAPPASPMATSEPTPEPSPAPDYIPYRFGTPLEETGPVEDDSFFDGAVFLGDSRTEGFQLFSGLKHGDFYWARGMTVFRADDPGCAIFEVDGEMLTLIGALGKKSYDAVYIMIGVNELGYAASQYEAGLSALIDKVLAAQPEAVVYLQLLPPVNDAIAAENNLGSYINNTNVNLFNEAIVRVAAEKRVVLLNTAEVYRDADGQLMAELAADGCHFTYDGYARWADYLRCHVMDPERYRHDRGLAERETEGME